MGSVAVGVFLMESNGSAYNWSDSEVTQTLNGIYSAMDWWINRGGAAAHLSFTYDLHIRQPTSYEPIQGPSSNDYLWVGEAMVGLGYSSSGIWQYLNDLRTARGTNWAYSIFVVDSSTSVSQGRFTDGAYAWGYFGGPWLVMSRYSSWAYNAANYYQAVPAHETGHIFYATDEYNSFGEVSGYLNVHDNDGASCLMNQNYLGNLCAASTLQIGWRDSDGDGIHDILDTNPETTLAPLSPDPTVQTVLGYTGTATVVPLINQNPNGSGNDITLQTLTRVEFRVDSGVWLQAIPDDGSFNGPVESFHFNTPSLTPGSHTVEARAVSSVGNLDATPASDTVTVTAGSYTLNISKAGSGTGTVTSSPGGINCGTDCSEPYASGTSVTLTATPVSGSTFAGWSGGCSGTGSCMIAMTSAQTVTATFSFSEVVLQNDVPFQDTINATIRQGSWKYYSIDVASGSSNLVVDLYSLSADVDLYVRFGDKPTLSSYNCRPYVGGLTAEQCSVSSPAAGRWWIGVNNWDTGSTTYTVRAKWSAPAFGGDLSFYTVLPCRVFDSRNGLALDSEVTRQIQFTGVCGIPSSAKAVSINLTVVQPSSGGNLVLWPSGVPVNTGSINFLTGEVRANNAILALAANGQGTLSARPSLQNAGTVHLILDVNGYFQ